MSNHRFMKAEIIQEKQKTITVADKNREDRTAANKNDEIIICSSEFRFASD